MSITVFRRPPRQRPPEMPSGELSLQEPPVLPEAPTGNMGTILTYVPMAIGSSVMMMMFMMPGRSGVSGGSGITMMVLMSMTSLTMVFGQVGRNTGDRKRRMRGERRDYLRYLAQTRKQVRAVAEEQRTALAWRHPDPAGLWSVAMSNRLWERRASNADFAEIRIGLSAQRLAMTIKPMQTKPVEDLEPLCARALRRFTRAYTTVSNLPTAVFLRGFAQVQMLGDGAVARDLARAMLAQLVTFHSPDDLQIAVVAGKGRSGDWDWVKWLPHAQHASRQDGAGALRLLVSDLAELDELLAEELAERGQFEAGATPSRDEPYLMVILDGASVPAEHRLAGTGYRNVIVVDVSGELTAPPSRTTLRLDVKPELVEMVRFDRTGGEVRTALGVPDRMSAAKVTSLARVISPYRLGAVAEVSEPMTSDFDLGMLLGVGDVGDLEAAKAWARTAGAPGPNRLKVPLGIAEDGSRVELDIKESAQGGMGPHGLLIGATGSGKSELLRTLVLAMAMTHSSEYLNFVLVDFKGGATFLGLDSLPHTSAVITNLADEASLVTRMQESLQGEMNRRQELLRRAGNYASLLDYERARAAGTPLDPMPTLFVVVDEFSELLASHPDFTELFVMIGRLGRSLGVHLLLASQRIEDGRMHKLESHLSYRIGLKTFSAMESRSVIGVPDAYQLPSSPGNGYLRCDVTTLVRFKAAYVSGKYRRRTVEQRQEEVRRSVVAFGAAEMPRAPEPAQLPVAVAEPEAGHDNDEIGDSLLTVAVERLKDQGPPAHRVWLPPLEAPPTLDQILPPLVPDPVYGLCPAGWPGRGRLVVPIAVIDKPYEQVRDLMMADLSGGGGNVGIAGGPQGGKSTVIRTLISALALTHTPQEVQFYCLDFGGGSLSTLAGLPHVGGVAGRMEPEKISRTVSEVLGVLRMREKLFTEHSIENMADYRALRRRGGLGFEDPFGDVFLVVDGWSSLRADFEDQDAPIRALASRGLAYGVHVIIASGRWSDMHSVLRDQLGTRIELRLGDTLDSVIDMRAAAKVPKAPGRGLTMDKMHFQSAVPRIDGWSRVDDLADGARAMAEAVDDCWAGPAAPPVRMLPPLLHVADMPAPEGQLRMVLGLDEAELQPVWHDFRKNPNLTVMGDSGVGKTNALRLVLNSIPKGYTPDQAQVIIVDSRRMLLDAVPPEYRRGFAFASGAASELVKELAEEVRVRVPGVDVTPQQLARRDWWSGPEYFVVVDDYDLLTGYSGGPLDSLVDLIPQAGDIGLHIVVARNAAGSSRLSSDQSLRRLAESNTPEIAMSCPPNEMPLLNGTRPKLLPVGRAQLVTRRNATLMQLAWLEAPSMDEEPVVADVIAIPDDAVPADSGQR